MFTVNSSSTTPFVINAAGALYTMFGVVWPGIIKRSLAVLRQAYDGHPTAMQGYILRALAQFLNSIDKEQDHILVRKLKGRCPSARFKCGPGRSTVTNPGMNLKSVAYVAALRRAFTAYKNKGKKPEEVV